MDSDLASVQNARDLLARAREAQRTLHGQTQQQVDAICAAMAAAGERESEPLARMAVEETGMGRVDSKTLKNLLCTRDLWAAIKGMKTVGIIRRDNEKMVYEIAEPMGVVAAIIPTTNPTSTALFKIIIALKSRNAIVISPHPRAARCIAASARVLGEAALKAGAPEGCIGCMASPTLEGTTELMRHPDTGVILATGGAEMVRAAYSSGKPALGVGPGNVPVYIDRSADVTRAVDCIVDSMLFDYGTVCASEQSVIVDAPIREAVVEAFKKRKAYFVSAAEKAKLEPVVIKGKLHNPDVVGRSAHVIATMSGLAVPEETSVLMVPMESVGPGEPISREKLCPVLGFYAVEDWRAGCERCIEVLRFGGMGHTLVIHARDEKVVMEFALKKPAYRLLVNTPATQGSVGMTTNLLPSMTLGCGTDAGNITTDNVGPMNLLNIKRLAFDPDDPFAARMCGAPEPVSGVVPVEKKPEPAPEPEPVLIYNGRPREIRSL